MFTSKSTIIAELSVPLCNDITLEDARVLATNSRKNKIPIPECQETASIFKSSKAFYTQFNNKYYMILVYADHANVVPIPNQPLDIVWYSFRHDLTGQWQKWAMGWQLPMMFKYLINEFQCNAFEITDKFIIGSNKKGHKHALHLEQEVDYENLPQLPTPVNDAVPKRIVKTDDTDDMPPSAETPKPKRGRKIK